MSVNVWQGGGGRGGGECNPVASKPSLWGTGVFRFPRPQRECRDDVQLQVVSLLLEKSVAAAVDLVGPDRLPLPLLAVISHWRVSPRFPLFLPVYSF